MEPVILDLCVDGAAEAEDFYRLRLGDQVKYLIVAPGTFPEDSRTVHFELFPLLPPLPCDEQWTEAHISRDKPSGDLTTRFTNRELDGVQSRWHHVTVDCRDLRTIRKLSPAPCRIDEVTLESNLLLDPPSSATVIAKIAPFRTPDSGKSNGKPRYISCFGVLGLVHAFLATSLSTDASLVSY
ncbi:hypothetical protein OPQ81_008082 [Rhizoctonia solani]|nr:hypothetical protein OPQ81_008082 [Rhizoctonia solani]